MLAERCRDDFFEPNTFQMLNSVSGASTIAKIDYWEQTDENGCSCSIHFEYVPRYQHPIVGLKDTKSGVFSICQKCFTDLEQPKAT